MKTFPVSPSLRILCLEDDPDDRQLMEQALKNDGLDYQIVHVQGRNDFEANLKQNQFDVVVSDFSLPEYGGQAALEAVKKIQPETPFVLLSGTVGEERAVEFLKSGATDCVLKQNLGRLGPAIRRAIREAGERKKRQAAEELLQIQAGQLRALAASVQAGREEERMRISRELHDELGGALAAQKFGLSWLRQRLANQEAPVSPQEIFAKLDSLGSLIDETANRMRRLCTQLRPSILDNLGLFPAIEWQAREFQTNTGIACKLSHADAGLTVPGEQATAIFRIFQEILTNVARHAGASEVTVELLTADQELYLQVRDNGRGIEENRLEGGVSLGILGMRERTRLLGGEFSIQGKSGAGTTVTVKIPLRENRPNPVDERLEVRRVEASGAPAVSAAPKPLRILVVDDHVVVRDGLKRLLHEHFPGAGFGEAEDSHQALDLLDNADWDVMLLDLSIPGGGGMDVLSQARNIQPRTKILVLTMHPADQYAVRVLRAGAAGYLTKESAAEEIVAAVEKILAGGKYVTAALAEKLIFDLGAAEGKKPHEQLSDREYQVLVSLAGGKNVKEIGAELFLSVKTISTYRSRLLAKLGLKTNADLVSYAMREKLIG